MYQKSFIKSKIVNKFICVYRVYLYDNMLNERQSSKIKLYQNLDEIIRRYTVFFKEVERRLGPEAELGLHFYLLNDKGGILLEDGYKQDKMLPMASTKKVAIGLLILKMIYADQSLSLDTKIRIKNDDFSAGRPSNSLDRYFFRPWSVTLTRTIDELLTFMLTESDNTSTDVLLDLAGGPLVVNAFMRELGLMGHQLSFSSKELLAQYFKLSTKKSIGNILKTLYEFISAYSLRPTERLLLKSEEDACTPHMMTSLLSFMVSKMNEEGWMHEASEVLFNKMQRCKTGETLIKKGARDFASYYDRFGSKQGGLGGIRNDTAFMHFKEGGWAILSIHTCQSRLSLKKRDELIANLAKTILIKHCELKEESLEDVSTSAMGLLLEKPREVTRGNRCILF